MFVVAPVASGFISRRRVSVKLH